MEKNLCSIHTSKTPQKQVKSKVEKKEKKKKQSESDKNTTKCQRDNCDKESRGGYCFNHLLQYRIHIKHRNRKNNQYIALKVS